MNMTWLIIFRITIESLLFFKIRSYKVIHVLIIVITHKQGIKLYHDIKAFTPSAFSCVLTPMWVLSR